MTKGGRQQKKTRLFRGHVLHAQISFFPANKIRADLRFGLAEPITFETNELRPIGIETNEALE